VSYAGKSLITKVPNSHKYLLTLWISLASPSALVHHIIGSERKSCGSRA
jgi:hypothetical protein